MVLAVILDDRSTNQIILSKLVISAVPGALTKLFANPHETLAWIARVEPDLILTDYRMPLMSGADFIHRLRKLRTCFDVPVMTITAYRDRAARLSALEAGAVDVIHSPVDHAEFTARVRNLMRASWQRRKTRDRADRLLDQALGTRLVGSPTMRQNPDELSAILDHIPTLISFRDKSGVCRFANRFLTDLAGVTNAIADLDEPEVWFGNVRQARSKEADQAILATKRDLQAFHETITTAIGLEMELITRKTLVYDSIGGVLGVLTSSRISSS